MPVVTMNSKTASHAEPVENTSGWEETRSSLPFRADFSTLIPKRWNHVEILVCVWGRFGPGGNLIVTFRRSSDEKRNCISMLNNFYSETAFLSEDVRRIS